MQSGTERPDAVTYDPFHFAPGTQPKIVLATAIEYTLTT